MKEWYQQSAEQVLDRLGSSLGGLSEDEAGKLLLEHGENVLKESKKKTVLQVFLSQFADLLVVILIIAALVSALSGNGESTLVILAVILLNACLGTVQHKKAEKSLDSLKALSSPRAKVLRDGKKLEIDSKKVVPGDILLLEAGDLVVADGRILDNFSLQVNESALTGESANVEKLADVITEAVPLGDRLNMVYSSSLVTYGRAAAVVTGTGMDTEIGKIAALMNDTKEKKTPLQVSLDQFSRKLAAGILVICVIVFALSLYRHMALIDSLMFAVALAVAAIPEALSSIVTIVQAIGTQKMAREHAVIKDLKAVESLGCVSVICSDKTGTLTQNRMKVQTIYIDGRVLKPEELDLKNQLHRYLLYDAILTNDSAIVDGKGIGDPTEYSLLELAREIDVKDEAIRALMPRLEELPFDSDRKLMTAKYRLRGIPTMLTKGALDVLLDRTVSIRTSSGIRLLTDEDKDRIQAQNLQFSKRGLRVLAFAYKETDEEDTLDLSDEDGYIFLGLISMMDPPRPESKEAVADAKRAGIKPVMITGDHKVTARAIAEQIGIFEEGDLALTGAQLDRLSDQELSRSIEKISVYARVSPENKIRIVEAWQRKGHVAAMTGDGVNDAPALKKADIGVAMGITGTEVSKDAASMILTDDNFATIMKAVANGRTVYQNIKNAIKFLLSGNMAGILCVLFTSVMGLPVPFAPVHLLFINLLTDSLPAIAIGMEPAGTDLLLEAPRDPKEGILTKRFLTQIISQGALIAVCTMFAFYVGNHDGGAETASTMAFAALAGARLFHGFNCRSRHSIFKIGFRKNWYSLGAFAAGSLLLALVILLPGLQKILEVQPLNQAELWIVCLAAVLPTAVIQAWKVVL